jgi:hypothetical protein
MDFNYTSHKYSGTFHSSKFPNLPVSLFIGAGISSDRFDYGVWHIRNAVYLVKVLNVSYWLKADTCY